MKTIDRHILGEVVRFTLLALLSVVVIYLLIDLFEELNYFLTRKVSIFTVLLYYVYILPSAVTLLYPVSMLLAVFVVYGQMTRHRELHALESAGVRALRLFAPAVGFGLATVPAYLAGNEFLTIPANAALADLRSYKIEKRAIQTTVKRRDVFFVGESGRVYSIREYDSNGVMTGFSIEELGSDRKVRRRIDGASARYVPRVPGTDDTGAAAPDIRHPKSRIQNTAGVWVGYDVTVREFASDGTERMFLADTMVLSGITETPADFVRISRPVQETSTRELTHYIGKMRRAGEDVADEEVELHYRFSYSLIGLIVVLLGLPLSVRLRKGGVMFGLGLGLLVSFLYWGATQLCRAYGTSPVISPAMAAWIPNIVFGAIAVVLMLEMRQ
ncbi:MAG: LptF/LptG family permease [candidate division WOR-3 bacterium]